MRHPRTLTSGEKISKPISAPWRGTTLHNELVKDINLLSIQKEKMQSL